MTAGKRKRGKTSELREMKDEPTKAKDKQTWAKHEPTEGKYQKTKTMEPITNENLSYHPCCQWSENGGKKNKQITGFIENTHATNWEKVSSERTWRSEQRSTMETAQIIWPNLVDLVSWDEYPMPWQNKYRGGTSDATTSSTLIVPLFIISVDDFSHSKLAIFVVRK